MLPGVRELALAGLVTGAGARNWAGGSGVELFDGLQRLAEGRTH